MSHPNSGSTRNILVVDDEPEIVACVCEFLTGRGFNVLGLSNSLDAASRLGSFRPDVCILDFRIPERSGAEFLLKPVELNQLLLSVSRALEHRRLINENENYRFHLEQLVLEQTKALNQALTGLEHVYSATLDALSMALDFRDQSTSGHSRRVAELTAGAASAMGIKDAALVQIEHGALLHDIGKLKIPDSILWKPAKLTEDEWKIMKRHAEYGFEFLSNIGFLKDAAEIVYSHHEKYDGTGYPRGLQRDNIPFGARVFAIVDTVDAMIYKRPYNVPVSFREAAAEVRRCAGTQFDPSLVETTLAYLDDHVPPQLK